jgi:hypothetical protein
MQGDLLGDKKVITQPVLLRVAVKFDNERLGWVGKLPCIGSLHARYLIAKPV